MIRFTWKFVRTVLGAMLAAGATGEVLAKRTENGLNLVDVAVKFTNQRGEESVRATATIALPSKDNPLPLYPEVPRELAQKAAAMMARHWELGGK